MVLIMILYLISIIIIFICFLYLKFHNFPPGPIGIPVLGYLPFLSTKPHVKLLKLKTLYGNVFSFKFGDKLAVVLNDWESVKSTYVTNGSCTSGRFGMLFRILNNGRGIVHSEGLYWKEQKKFYMTAIRDGINTLQFQKDLHFETKLFVNCILNYAKTTNYWNPRAFVQGCFVNNVCQMVFGKRFNYSDLILNQFLRTFHINFLLIGKKAGVLNFLPSFLYERAFVKRLFGYDELFDNINEISCFLLSLILQYARDRDRNLNLDKKPLVEAYLQKLWGYDPSISLDFECPKRPLNIVRELLAKGLIIILHTGNELAVLKESFGKNYEILSDTPTAGQIYMAKVQTFLNDLENGATMEEKTNDEKAFIKFLLSGDILSGFSGLDMYISLIDMFLGGVETSQAVMRWGLYFLGQHPAIQDRIYDELNYFLETCENQLNDGRHDSCISYEDRHHLPYTYATLQEILRRACIAPLGLFHTNTVELENFSQGRYTVPKRSVLIANHWALHHDPTLWSADPYTFEPCRFLKRKIAKSETEVQEMKTHSQECESKKICGNDCAEGIIKDANLSSLSNANGLDTSTLEHTLEDMEANGVKGLANRYAVVENRPGFIPFSLGPRTCIGMQLARNELFTVLANLMLRFRFTFPPDSPVFKPGHDATDDGVLAITWDSLPYELLIEPRQYLQT